MKEYTSKVELTNAIKASYKKYIDEFENSFRRTGYGWGLFLLNYIVFVQ